jgi:hypothetical protein
MTRLNLDPLMTFTDGSQLVVSTHCTKEGEFSCALYSVVTAKDDRAVFRIVSGHLASPTCLDAQEYAYEQAVQLFPHAAMFMKKPPYLIISSGTNLVPPQQAQRSSRIRDLPSPPF